MGVIIILNLGIEEIVTITVATSEEREVEASSKKSNLRLKRRGNFRGHRNIAQFSIFCCVVVR